ncbi:hypothetical protein [Sediminicurvatus halobius]|uniref:hypothetical protein n=1 Tax=Sediminicurvatus halobius TaxID=2182432 RepID=UPI001304E5AE|nr:hypothetical protein [Spiribacter halobius]UEX76620.1 hypothetical protein LMH63_11700 [Spiribacter halobius]
MQVPGYADAYTLAIPAGELEAVARACGPDCAAATPEQRRCCARAALRGRVCPCLAGAPQLADRLSGVLEREALQAAGARREAAWDA